MTASISTLATSQPNRPGERLARFAVVGASGFVVNSAVLALASGVFNLHYVIGAVISTFASTTSNFVLTERFVFGDRNASNARTERFAVFLALSLVTLLARGPILIGFTEVVGLHYLLSNAISLACLMVARYRFAGSRIWPEDAR